MTVLRAYKFNKNGFVLERYALGSSRSFSVKELPWCAPSGAPTRQARAPVLSKKQAPNEKYEPIKRFGIVAAVSACNSRVIGMDGRIPWSVPEDRKIFKSLTKDKVLIIGRHTLDEHANLIHIDHAKHCIVVSRSMEHLDKHQQYLSSVSVSLHLARSFSEALHLARKLGNTIRHEDNNSLYCWVAGGERIYEEALKHSCAAELHISWIQITIPLLAGGTTESSKVARFPAKYRWDNKFKSVSEVAFSKSGETPSFIYRVYRPLKTRK